jgi:Family of unknown function (DUF6788)
MREKKLQQIEGRIEKIKKELKLIGEMRPGTLSKQYKDPKEKRGEYYQLSFTHKMKSRTEYIRPVFVKEIEGNVKTYKMFKNLVEGWIDLSIEYSRLKMNLAKRNKLEKDYNCTSKNGELK